MGVGKTEIWGNEERRIIGLSLSKYFFGFIFLVAALSCDAQSTFFKTYGGTNKEEGKCLALCSDGGFIIGADVTLIPPAPDSSNILIVRTNSLGDTLWTRIINSGENDFCAKIIETSDMGFAVLANRVSSSNNSKVILIKLDGSGVIQWQKTFLKGGFGCTSYSFIEKLQGGYLICGTKVDTSRGGLLINTNSVGDTLWTKNEGMSSINSLVIHGVKQLADSSFVILSAMYNLNIFYPRFWRIDSMGNILYSTEYSDLSFDDGITASSANMIESYQFALAGSGRTGLSERFIIKFDSLFNIQWSQKYNFPIVNVISSIVQTQDSGFVFIAAPNSPTSAHYCLMIKTNSSGTVSWAKQFQYASFRTPQYEYARNSGQNTLIITPDNGIAFCGFFMDTISTNNKDLVLIKTDANGNIPCDGITATVTSSPLSFVPSVHTNFISRGLFMTATSLTAQGGIPTNNLCFTTSANENYSELKGELNLSPNPATNEIIIESGAMEITAVEVYDVVGQRVLTHPQPPLSNTMANAQRGLRLDVSSLSEGIYFVTIRDEKGNRATKKFVKM
jgi:hypothetical protein